MKSTDSRTRVRKLILGSESRSGVRSEYSPAIEGLQESLRLQLGTPARARRERRVFREGRIVGLREAVIWLKKLEAAAVIEREERARMN